MTLRGNWIRELDSATGWYIQCEQRLFHELYLLSNYSQLELDKNWVAGFLYYPLPERLVKRIKCKLNVMEKKVKASIALTF